MGGMAVLAGWTPRARTRLIRWFGAILVRDFLGQLLLEERQFETAERTLRLALGVLYQHGPTEDLARVRYLLGTLHRQQGQDEEAVETYRRVIADCALAGTREAARFATLARLGVAEACLRLERYAQAEEAGLRVVHGAPDASDEGRMVRAAAAAGIDITEPTLCTTPGLLWIAGLLRHPWRLPGPTTRWRPHEQEVTASFSCTQGQRGERPGQPVFWIADRS